MAGDKVKKSSKDSKSSSGSGPSKEPEPRPGTSKDDLLLAAEMSRVPDPKLRQVTPSYGKPPSTPSFTPKGAPSPVVSGVVQVQAQAQGDNNMVAKIIELMNVNNKAQDKKNEKLLNSFMEKMMGNFGAGSPSQGQAPAPKGSLMTVAPAQCAAPAPKRKRSPSPPEPDSNAEEEVSEEQEEDDDYEDLSDEEEQGSDLLDHFGSASPAFVPTEKQLEMWMRALKLDPDYGKDAWTKVKAKGIIKKWVDHPSAGAFTAPEPEEGVPGLVFPDHKEFEKDFSRLQDAAGTIAAIATRIMCLIQGMFV